MVNNFTHLTTLYITVYGLFTFCGINAHRAYVLISTYVGYTKTKNFAEQTLDEKNAIRNSLSRFIDKDKAYIVAPDH